MLRVSYIPGKGTGRQGSAPYPAYERPYTQNATNYPNCYISGLSRLGRKELDADNQCRLPVFFSGSTRQKSPVQLRFLASTPEKTTGKWHRLFTYVSLAQKRCY